jgi:type III secretory pathway component EscT
VLGPIDAQQLVEQVADLSGMDLAQWALAWARVLPTVLLVPAFGLRALPGPVRWALGLALAAAIVPAVSVPSDGSWGTSLLAALVVGGAVAVLASLCVWIATTAGGAIDDLRGSRVPTMLPTVERGATVSGGLLGVAAAVAFLESGGPARVASSLARAELTGQRALLTVSAQLVSGIEIAVAVVAPIIAVALVFEVAAAFVARSATPAAVAPLVAPVRSLFILGVTALLLDRLVATIALHAPLP